MEDPYPYTNNSFLLSNIEQMSNLIKEDTMVLQRGKKEIQVERALEYFLVMSNPGKKKQKKKDTYCRHAGSAYTAEQPKPNQTKTQPPMRCRSADNKPSKLKWS